MRPCSMQMQCVVAMRGAYRKLAFASILFPVKQNPLGKRKVCFRKQKEKKSQENDTLLNSYKQQ